MSKRNGSPPSRHPERSKGSSDLASSPLQEIPHCIRDDGVSGRADRSKLDMKPEDLLLIQSILKQWAPHCDVWAYGSRVSGHCHESSDLDLVVRHPNDLKKPTEHLARLKQAFKDSELPIFVDVMDWAYLPESYRSEIEKNYFIVQR